MHIPWTLYLTILAILTCNPFIHSVFNAVYADRDDNVSSAGSGIIPTSSKKSGQATRIQYANGGGSIYGITIYDKLLATAFDNSIAVGNISSSMSVEDVCGIRLPRPIRNQLLEFKFIDRETLLYCDTAACRLCMLSSLEEPCYEYQLTWNGKKVKELLYATAAKDSRHNVNIRFVTDNIERAAILRFPSQYAVNRPNELSSVQSAEDMRFIDGHGLATAFNRHGYTFFVGSARRPYEPYINAGIEDLRVMSVRITRVCDRDRTENLESRIDMALTCGNFSLRTNVHSLAAEYDSDSDDLIVVFQNAETNRNLACKYNMGLVDSAFNQIWNDCQNISFKSSAEECRKIQNSKDLPSHCYVFSRRADGYAMRMCSRFGGNYTKEKLLGNCELESFSSSAYRYGWLEQFRAFEGQLVAVLPSYNEDVLSVKRFREDGALFIVHSGPALERILTQKHETPSSLLWSLQLQQQSDERTRSLRFHVATDVLQNRLYFARNNEIRYIELACSSFYDSCDSLERSGWSDPMQCRWCAMKNGSGYAFSPAKGHTCSFFTVDNFCTPFIEHVNIPSSSSSNYTSFEVYGGKFDRLQNIAAKVCDQNCVISTFAPTKLSCKVDMSNNIAQGCSFYLDGKLGSHGYFNITFESAQTHYTEVTNSVLASIYPHYSKRNRTIATIIAMIVLAFLIMFILHLLRRFHKHQRIRMKKSHKSGSQIALDTSNAVFVGSNPFIGLTRKDHQIKTFNPYENLFMEIDPKLKIPLKDLKFGSEIGKGNFGVVYQAVYRDIEGRTVEVACKTIDSQSDGVVTGVSEFLREGLIMANFDHPNVARLIGISLTENSYPIIVTDFMARGDLRHYIINPENRLTFGNLLDFGIQIAKGMTYLHDIQFIHRDLAARNCMLDANLVVKIADFGLSRDVSRCGMYQAIHKDRGIPIRWMPIESLEEQQYTFKADVWAYGVVLWELATRGLVPYADLEFADILRLLKNGRRLMKPKGCPDNLYYHVMLPCWMEDPQCRPTFVELTEMMEDVVRQLRRGNSGGALLDSHYERVSARSFAASPVATNDSDTKAGPIITDL